MRGSIAFFLLVGCAVQVRGVVRPKATGISIMEPEGQIRQLIVGSKQADELRWLDGEEVTVFGRGGSKKVTVERWELHEGTHGIQSLVGIIGQSPRGLGIHDRTSQGFYTLDDKAADELIEWLGRPVLIEGYVEGAQALHVVYYRPLADPETAP